MSAPLRIPTARVYHPLLAPSRFKALYGGRGSGKSHFLAGLLVEESIRKPGLRAVCIREVQKSLRDSAKRLIEDKLESLGLGPSEGFRVMSDEIRTPGGGIITFQGLADHTAESIKSLEGVDRAWCEEAHTLSTRSISLLRPTIRAPDSEIWFSWNPRQKTDPVDAIFRSDTPPSNAIIVASSWRDNPWLPAELNIERLDCLANDPDQYAHIWEGEYVTVAQGAYYAQCLAQAKAEGRLSRLHHDPLLRTRAFWDIGGTGMRADSTAIWIAQFVGREIRVLDYYEAQGQPLATHVNWLRDKGYSSALCVLPHDGVAGDKVHQVSYESALRQAEIDVMVVKNQGAGAAKARIESARRLFPSVWIDNEACSSGLQALGWYHEKRDEHRGIGLGPCHDWSSHAADAFGLMCIAHGMMQGERPAEQKRQHVHRAIYGGQSHAWMM